MKMNLFETAQGREIERLREQLNEVRRFIADDSNAATCLEQYRSDLIGILRKENYK